MSEEECILCRQGVPHHHGTVVEGPLQQPARVRRKRTVDKKQRHPIDIQDKTYQMLREYCRLNETQIRSEIDGLIQYAIEARLKAST